MSYNLLKNIYFLDGLENPTLYFGLFETSQDLSCNIEHKVSGIFFCNYVFDFSFPDISNFISSSSLFYLYISADLQHMSCALVTDLIFCKIWNTAFSN